MRHKNELNWDVGQEWPIKTVKVFGCCSEKNNMHEIVLKYMDIFHYKIVINFIFLPISIYSPVWEKHTTSCRENAMMVGKK